MKNNNGLSKNNYSVWLKFAEEDMTSAKALLSEIQKDCASKNS